MSRRIILDIETTGRSVKEGHRIIDITAVEMNGCKQTGLEFRARVNPDRDIPADATAIHGITNDMVADKPFFAQIAKELRDFIGNTPIIITCRTDADGYTPDMAMLKMEMEAAGFPPFRDDQWINVRRWSEAMFGPEKATLDKVVDHYRVDRSERDEHGHAATFAARLLSEVFPKLEKDYARYLEDQKVAVPAARIVPPAP